jgi:outer membrane biosynthesis protein TonB
MSQPPDDDRTVAAPAIRGGAESALGANALSAGTRLHEFEIVDLIGEGGFGIVYLARDCVLERKVALKEYLPAALASRGPGATVAPTSTRSVETFQIGLRSFMNEARMLAQFDHPALVKVYRFWEANGTAYMVMPYYQGITLKEALRSAGAPPDEARLKQLLAQLLDALEVLHRAQALHRDIAPDNILILPDGNPVLLDFGAARRVITDRTQALTAILKPGYAPIEQYGESPSLKQGPWTDLYALAGVFHFAITGAAPTPAVTRTITDPVVPLNQAAAGRYSAQFLRALDQALSVNPANRPQSVEAFRSLLEFDHVPKTLTRAARETVQRPAAGRDWLRLGVYAGAAIVLAAAIGAVALLKKGPPTPPPKAATSVPAPAPAPQSTQPALATDPTPAAVPTPAPPPTAVDAPQPSAKEEQPRIVEPPPAKPAAKASALARQPKVPAAEEPPRPDNRLAVLLAAFLQDGEKCFQAKQYDCAIAKANDALQVDPASAQARRLKAAASDEQQRALRQIKIE